MFKLFLFALCVLAVLRRLITKLYIPGTKEDVRGDFRQG